MSSGGYQRVTQATPNQEVVFVYKPSEKAFKRYLFLFFKKITIILV